jgi:hypothetical protein
MPSHALTLSDHLSIDSIKEGIDNLPTINAISLLLMETADLAPSHQTRECGTSIAGLATPAADWIAYIDKLSEFMSKLMKSSSRNSKARKALQNLCLRTLAETEHSER